MTGPVSGVDDSGSGQRIRPARPQPRLIIKRFSGAFVSRVIDRANAKVPEHAHDWPIVSVFVFGAYDNHTEMGGLHICSPSAVFYRAGAAHRNEVSTEGFEQIEIEFDPAWLGQGGIPCSPVHRWIGGRPAAEARSLAQLCCREFTEEALLAGLRRLFEEADAAAPRARAGWVGSIDRRLKEDATLRVADLAHEFKRHPSWLGTAYKWTTGEGIPQAAARFRLERAAHLLRETELPYAQVACDAGFCDQSHMNRTFRRVLGRTPSAVRGDRGDFRPAVRSA